MQLEKQKKEQTEQIKKLENALSQVESENSAFKTRIEMLQKEIQAIKESVNEKSEKLDRLADILQIIVNDRKDLPEETKEKFRKMLVQKYYTKNS
jgi:septal ring factor EnvC (AmiA/AmiB activator)